MKKETTPAMQWKPWQKQMLKISGAILASVIIIIIIAVNFSDKKTVATSPEQTTESTNGEKRDLETRVWEFGKELVKVKLKDPSTAVFPEMTDGNFIEVDWSTVTINSYVDTQNSYGKKRRIGYHVEMKYKGGDVDSPQSWEVIDCSLKE